MNQHHSALSEFFRENFLGTIFGREKIHFFKKKYNKIGKTFFSLIFSILWSRVLTQIDFFQAKSLSYNNKILLGLLLVQLQRIWWNRFYANSNKLWFWAKMAIFQHIWPKSVEMRNFIKNRAVLFFYPYCPPTSCQVSEKSVERFPRSIRY